ncbi:trace amine-associated receptor 13c-like [Melanotaenia boesemani]|uniref:trace amine-associated receptor 13c-like n=1 Tax=Melanotaenia boesemani TaxID=1250792 RepID=UPI001C05BC0C|nr:trace amine-associated receptor 13c-like [Melanotaenia boesemani]
MMMMEILDEAKLCVPHLNSSCRRPTHPPTTVMLIYVLLSSVSFITVALNLLVIISISHFRQLHTPTNILLLSLAVSDLLVGLLLMPVEIIYINVCWFLGDVVCTLYYIMDYIITSASVSNMVLISLDRYVAICDPLRYHSKVTNGTAKMCVCLCWICSVLYSLLLLHEQLEEPGRSNSCFGECVVVISHIAGLVDMVLTFLLPIAVIVFLYCRVFVVVLHQARMLKSKVAAQHSGALTVRKKEMKAAITLGKVVLVFLICFCPHYFPTMAGEDTFINASSAAFDIWLAHFKSCLNPVIYAFFYPWFRKSVKLILTLRVLQPGSRETGTLF